MVLLPAGRKLASPSGVVNAACSATPFPTCRLSMTAVSVFTPPSFQMLKRAISALSPVLIDVQVDPLWRALPIWGVASTLKRLLS